ncbi:MAG TPA: hypothetical protein VFZ59_25830 [Verrucomicrobiae bacterium]|nr:hypothetical protein [Verrucomicrobiae bacterium]
MNGKAGHEKATRGTKQKKPNLGRKEAQEAQKLNSFRATKRHKRHKTKNPISAAKSARGAKLKHKFGRQLSVPSFAPFVPLCGHSFPFPSLRFSAHGGSIKSGAEDARSPDASRVSTLSGFAKRLDCGRFITALGKTSGD